VNTGNSFEREPRLALVLFSGNSQTFVMSTGTMEPVDLGCETAGPRQEKASPYLPYRRALLSAALIKELSTPKPWRAMVDAAICWALILAAMGLVAYRPSWWTVLLAIPVIGNRYYALFIIGHDGLHRRLFPTIKKNDFWNDLLIMAPIGAITRLNNRNHLAHHRELATENDPDRHKHACLNKAEHVEFLEFLSGVASFWKSVKAVLSSWSQKNVQNAPARSTANTHTLRDFVILAGWFGVLAGGLTWFIGWWAYPVLWLLPVYAFMVLGDNFRSFAEHSHPEGDEAADRHRLITYIGNPLERTLVAPMNMNFHVAHHLWPSIPYYNLPAADRLIRQHPAAAGLEWRGSYFAYLLTYWLALPIVECKQGR
jgi:fatty acid desaturase